MTNPHRLLLATVWGIFFAATVEHTEIGKYILEKINWLAVLVGVGVCWLIATPVSDDHAKQKQHNTNFFVLAFASIAPILQWAWGEKQRIGSVFVHTTAAFHRSIKNEQR